MGIEAEKIDQIIEMHTETVDALKAERDSAKEDANKYKADSAKLTDVQRELSDLKEKANQPDAYKDKYEKIKKDFETYKGEITAKETKDAKSKAYRAMLKEVGVSEKRLDTVMKVAEAAGFDTIELDENGKIKDVDELKAQVKDEWSDFIVSTGTQGANTPTPPANTGGSTYKTKKEIMAIKDYDERQKAIADNHQLFGF
jgi:DNA repair exonuclease SbcCD ATPase subunit